MRREPTFTQASDGEWVQPIKRGYRVACCDCGLVHRIAFRVRESRIQFRAVRDVAATIAYRRQRQPKEE